MTISNKANIKVGIYACKIDEYCNNVELCFAGDRPDFIVIGTFDQSKNFVGRVITNWCDKSPTDSLIFNGKSFWDQAGIAEDENGNNLWLEVSNNFSNLFSKIESLYDYLCIDTDKVHYNIAKEIPDEFRLFCLFEGNTINLINVKKDNGEKLGVEIFL